ncbi:hypothetical protein PBI_NABY_21 [Microbacterium phage Naby]|uniref:DUF6884 domain-containing protein n=1 Tax=Microbacterium phage BonaeVitae TaxID=2126925 RepID=A0A2R3ZZK1_9CAUD|nr:hypothetical protein JTF59_gp21 [Microbacterium phage BonaeVitae]AVR56171.1 hypothetical protein SEA_BONAEVITAE_21 [Microbacterium phage BonaeVitae]QFG10663.1 hypothetical protein PBI_NABY_21 [Microbacterium phage Naby]
MRVGLVACSASKLDHAAPARELYSSQLFRKASAYAAATCDQWFILSALHGLVAPESVLQPYDVRLGQLSPAERAQWRLNVSYQLQQQLGGASADVQLVALAGADYRGVLDLLPWPAEIPMQGLGIGQQLGFLTRELRQLGAAA